MFDEAQKYVFGIMEETVHKRFLFSDDGLNYLESLVRRDNEKRRRSRCVWCRCIGGCMCTYVCTYVHTYVCSVIGVHKCAWCVSHACVYDVYIYVYYASTCMC